MESEGANALAKVLCKVKVKNLYNEGRFEKKFGGAETNEDMRASLFYTEEVINAKTRGRMSLKVGKRGMETLF